MLIFKRKITTNSLLLSGQQIINKAVCQRTPPMPTEQISCGYNQIIDIISVINANVEEDVPCTVDSLLPVIEELPTGCKLDGKAFGVKVYKRYNLFWSNYFVVESLTEVVEETCN